MPEINLLSNNTKKVSVGSAIGSLMVKALAVVLIFMLVYWGYTLFMSRRTASRIKETTAQIEKDQQDILKNTKRDELLTRQVQLQEAEKIIHNHVYWSRFFKDIAKSTLRTSSYGGFTVDPGGVITVSVNVPDYQTLDQYLQVFDLPAYNTNISDIKIVSVSKVEKEGSQTLDARLRFNYNKQSLKETTK
jgi:cell division protein FtsB